jgi:hypothetical protein
MRMRRILPLIVLLAGLLAVPSTAASASQAVWHRLNPGSSLATSEHERLSCAQSGVALVCRYDKLPDPGFAWNATTGTFRGTDVTAGWDCPEWLGPEICDHVVAVYEGAATYVGRPQSGPPLTAVQDHIIVQDGARQVLFQYWIDQFACPWYPTFAEALAADPSLGFDCVLP